MNAPLKVNLERLKENIIELSSIGKESGGGIYRVAFTQADQAARHWLLKKLQDANIEASMDGALNIVAKVSPGERPSIMIGSHIDTVPNAGSLDGALGVLMGLECLQHVKENNVALNYPLELIAFSDEEGRFGGMFGSRSVAGLMTPAYIESAVDLDGCRLSEALRELGHDPYKALDAARAPESIRYFLEVHIEQGPVLDVMKRPLGIVTDITGLFKWHITLTGASNHAGTTPMDLRQDAFMGLADFAHEIPRIIEENGSETSRMTIGKVQLFPGSANTIPGKAMFSLDARDTSNEVMLSLQDASRKALSAIARRRKLKFDFEEISRIDPVACDRSIQKVFENAARQHKAQYHFMPSGAAHDTQMMANIAKVGMLFVPSKQGISHSPHEWTDWQDIETGANVLLNTVVQLT